LKFSVTRATNRDAGAGEMLTKLSEVFFAEMLRRYRRQLPPGQTGWPVGEPDLNLAHSGGDRTRIERDGLARMRRQHEHVRSKFSEERQGSEERTRSLARTCGVRVQIGPSNSFGKERVAGEGRFVAQHVRRALVGVAGRMARCDRRPTNGDPIAVVNGRERKIDASLIWQEERRLGLPCK
jgi:hypothetical protein